MRYIEDLKNLVLNWVNNFGENSILKPGELVNNLQPLPLKADRNDDGIHLKVEKLSCSLDSNSEDYKQGCHLKITDSFCEHCQN